MVDRRLSRFFPSAPKKMKKPYIEPKQQNQAILVVRSSALVTQGTASPAWTALRNMQKHIVLHGEKRKCYVFHDLLIIPPRPLDAKKSEKSEKIRKNQFLVKNQKKSE